MIISKNKSTGVFFLLMILLYSSCDTIFPEAEIPSYVSIDTIHLSINDPVVQGSASHKITDAWVFVNDDLQGVYELPVIFPVLKDGKQSLKIFAGIKDNGIAATRVQYPFFQFFSDNSFVFSKDEITPVNPSVSYTSSVKFLWNEDFEDPGITIDSVYPSFLKINRLTDPAQVFEGNGCGYVYLSGAEYIYKGASNTAFDLPKAGAAVYMELNYKTTANFNVTVFSNNPSGIAEDAVLTITPTNKSGMAEWNKIYVNLSPVVSANPSANGYKIAFYSNLSEQGLTSAEIFLDNIKLLCF